MWLDVPSNNIRRNRGIAVVGIRCCSTNSESRKQCEEPESTSVTIGEETASEKRDIRRARRSERADALSRRDNSVQVGSTQSSSTEFGGLRTNFLPPGQPELILPAFPSEQLGPPWPSPPRRSSSDKPKQHVRLLHRTDRGCWQTDVDVPPE